MRLLLENCFCASNLRLFNRLESIRFGPVAFFLFKVFSFCRFLLNLPLEIPQPACLGSFLLTPQDEHALSFTSLITLSAAALYFEYTRLLQMSFIPPSHQLFLVYFPNHPGFEVQILRVAPSFPMFQQVPLGGSSNGSVNLHFQFSKNNS